MKFRFMIMFILMLLVFNEDVMAQSHLDLFTEKTDQIEGVENLGYKQDFIAVYDDQPASEGYRIIRYVDDRGKIIVNCKIQFFTSEYSTDYENESEYNEMLNILENDKEKAKNTENNKWISYYVNGEMDVVQTGIISTGQQYFRTVIDGPVSARYMVRSYISKKSEEDYDSLVAAVDEYVEMMIKQGKAINISASDDQQTSEQIGDPLEEEGDKEDGDKEEEEAIKVRGRLHNFDLGDEDYLRKDLGDDLWKQTARIQSFFKEPSPDKAIFMDVVDFHGNILASYGPVLTDTEGRFELDYETPEIDEYDLFVIMPLSNYPDGVEAGPSIGIKDWVYAGGTENRVFLELAAKAVKSSDDEKEIGLEDLYISGGDTRRHITSESKDTDFINGFIYANSYLYAIMAEDFYEEMVGYKLSSSRDKPLLIHHNANKKMPSGTGGNYDHQENYINLSDYLSTWSGMHNASSAIYHEFSHKVMYDLYGGRYPNSTKEDWLIGTYGNQSTANSLTEGFAYFMQNAISEYYGSVGLIEQSPIYGHIEPNYPAWFDGGLHEARAVAGVLYDLYDQGRDGGGIGMIADDDTISIELKALVNLILEVPLDNVGQLYDKLVRTYPNQKKGIDRIFIEHGFFSVAEPLEEGIGIYHKGEAFVDSNKNYKYDQGEKVINFNGLDEEGFRFQAYKEGATIGYASYSGNEARQMQVVDPKYRIKTNSAYPMFTYEMTFMDAPFMNYSGTALNQEGFIQMPLLPYNHEMTVHVYPLSEGVEEATFTISSSDIKDNYESIIEQGYIGEFELNDNHLNSDYIPPLVTILNGGTTNMANPNVDPPEAINKTTKETKETETENIESKTDEISSNEVLQENHSESVEESKGNLDQDSTSQVNEDSDNLIDKLLNDLQLDSRRFIIFLVLMTAVGILIIAIIIYNGYKLIKK